MPTVYDPIRVDALGSSRGGGIGGTWMLGTAAPAAPARGQDRGSTEVILNRARKAARVTTAVAR